MTKWGKLGKKITDLFPSKKTTEPSGESPDIPAAFSGDILDKPYDSPETPAANSRRRRQWRIAVSTAVALAVTVTAVVVIIRLPDTSVDSLTSSTYNTTGLQAYNAASPQTSGIKSSTADTSEQRTDDTAAMQNSTNVNSHNTQPQNTLPPNQEPLDPVDAMTQTGAQLIAQCDISSMEHVTGAEILEDGSFVLVGTDYRSAAVIARYSRTGELVFIKTFSGTKSTSFHKVKQTKDGGFLAVGNTDLPLGRDFDKYGIKTVGVHEGWVLFLVKYNHIGEVQWVVSGEIDRYSCVSGLINDKIYEGKNGEIIFFAYSWADRKFSNGVFYCDAQGNRRPDKEGYFFSLYSDGYGINDIKDIELLSDGSVFISGTILEDNKKIPIIRRYGLVDYSCHRGLLLYERKLDGLSIDNMEVMSDDSVIITGKLGDLPEDHALIKELSLRYVWPFGGKIILKINRDGQITGHDIFYPIQSYTKEFPVEGISADIYHITDIGNGEVLFHLYSDWIFYEPLNKTVMETGTKEPLLYIMNKTGKLRAVSSVGVENHTYESYTISIMPYNGSYLFLTIHKTSDGAAAYLYRVNNIIR